MKNLVIISSVLFVNLLVTSDDIDTQRGITSSIDR